ncbi:hypothetical protein [Litoreibacter arenae]|uniref:Copper metallochaperone n=1 Tax=Litoreibacter arenae DSM 19593 TaxID=1123360 RepID=S9RW43_9RHOB|nr:hypothetical protein [Litoreibacter arenae]EPX78219.1 hypothetical protein thalar_02448 [Litoreibacter arenae DSM 19593]
MKGFTTRRAVLMAAAAIATSFRSAAAQSHDIRGEVGFEGGAVIPEGEIEISVEDSAKNTARHNAEKTRVKSDGKSKMIAFSMPSNSQASSTLEIVARLEKADGWLLARGSAPLKTGSRVHIMLNKAVY